MKTNLKVLLSFYLLAIFFSISVAAQDYKQTQRTDNFFSYPTRATTQADNGAKAQFNLFIDPTGEVPHDAGGGRQFGIEAVFMFDPGYQDNMWLYLSPSISMFPQLQDGYTDIVMTSGINWHMFHTTAIRYYTGLRLGVVWRGGGPNGMVGLAWGADVRLITFKEGPSLYFGGGWSYDWREDQADHKWGDSTGYSQTIFDHNQLRLTGILKIGFRL